MSALLRILVQSILEFPVKRYSLPELVPKLEEEGQQLITLYQSMPATEKNHKIITHVIGIERWGTHRLHSALGNPLVIDEYDDYRPARETPWTDLSAIFAETRQETVVVFKQLIEKGITSKILHNEWGKLSVRAWMRYLSYHSRNESRRLKATE